jgi:hypothetical protein
MKITKQKLTQIIKEEISHILNENTGFTEISGPHQIAAAIETSGKNPAGLYADLMGDTLIMVDDSFVTIKQTDAGPAWTLGQPQRGDGASPRANWMVRSDLDRGRVHTTNRLKWKKALMAAGVPEKNIKMGHHKSQ